MLLVSSQRGGRQVTRAEVALAPPGAGTAACCCRSRPSASTFCRVPATRARTGLPCSEATRQNTTSRLTGALHRSLRWCTLGVQGIRALGTRSDWSTPSAAANRSRLQLFEVWQPYALHDFNVQGCTRTNSIQSSWSMYTVNSHKQVMYAHRVTPDQRMN